MSDSRGGEGALAIATEAGPVTGLLSRPADARALLALAHGAGAGIRHRFFTALTPLLATHGVATLRYQFPYMERGGRRPDAPRVAHATVRAAVAVAVGLADGLPVFAGGKSFGGRMTSQAQSDAPMPAVRGLVFLGFPLHAARQPGAARGEHLRRVQIPMLFVQGSRDTLADLALLRPLVGALGDATLHVVAGGDHSFAIPKSAGRTSADALEEVAEVVATWMSEVAARPA